MFVLRSSIYDEPDFRVDKAWAFNPDIITQYGRPLSTEELTNTFDQFIDLPLQSNENNYIFVRGRDDSADEDYSKTIVCTLRAVAGELILWPQVWNKEQMLTPGPIVIERGGIDSNTVASNVPFEFKPSNLYGFHYAFVAVQDTIEAKDLNDPDTRVRDKLAPLPQDMKNWREYARFLKSDDRVAYSNIRIADPTSPCMSISTRLRLFEDDPQLRLTPMKFLVEHAGIPEDVEVSLSSDDGLIKMPLTKLLDDDKELGVTVLLPSTYHTVITLNIFQNPGSLGITCFGWISLQAIALTPSDEHCLLGAETIMFNADATRNAGFFHHLAFETYEELYDFDDAADEEDDQYHDQDVGVGVGEEGVAADEAGLFNQRIQIDNSGAQEGLEGEVGDEDEDGEGDSGAEDGEEEDEEYDYGEGGDEDLEDDEIDEYDDQYDVQYDDQYVDNDQNEDVAEEGAEDEGGGAFPEEGSPPVIMRLGRAQPRRPARPQPARQPAHRPQAARRPQPVHQPHPAQRQPVRRPIPPNRQPVHRPQHRKPAPPKQGQGKQPVRKPATRKPVHPKGTRKPAQSTRKPRQPKKGQHGKKPVRRAPAKKPRQPGKQPDKKPRSQTNPQASNRPTGPQSPTIDWWFRDTLYDANLYPRFEKPMSSPDIQPVGSSPLSNPADTLGGSNQSKDYSTDHKITTLHPGETSVIYVRGHTGKKGTIHQCCLYMLPNTVVRSPDQYNQNYVKERYSDRRQIRQLISNRDSEFRVFEPPFTVDKVERIGLKMHYCLVAEVREYTPNNKNPPWPHELAPSFKTNDELRHWLQSTPGVAWRNIHYAELPSATTKPKPRTNNKPRPRPRAKRVVRFVAVQDSTPTEEPLFASEVASEAVHGDEDGDDEFGHEIVLSLEIPPDPTLPNKVFQLSYEAVGFPETSEWRMSCDGASIPGLDIGVDSAIGTSIACQFSGIPREGYKGEITLEWWGNGSWPEPTARIDQVFSEVISPSSMASYARYAIPQSENLQISRSIATNHFSGIRTKRDQRPSVLNKSLSINPSPDEILVQIGTNHVYFN